MTEWIMKGCMYMFIFLLSLCLPRSPALSLALSLSSRNLRPSPRSHPRFELQQQPQSRTRDESKDEPGLNPAVHGQVCTGEMKNMKYENFCEIFHEISRNCEKYETYETHFQGLGTYATRHKKRQIAKISRLSFNFTFNFEKYFSYFS